MVQFFILYTQSFMEQNLEMMLLPSSGFNVNGFSAADGVTASFYFHCDKRSYATHST